MHVIIEHRKIGLVQPDDPVGRFVDRLGKLVADQRLFDLQRRHLNRSYLDDTFGTLNGDRALGKDLRPVLRCAVRLGGFDILYQQLIVDCHLDLFTLYPYTQVEPLIVINNRFYKVSDRQQTSRFCPPLRVVRIVIEGNGITAITVFICMKANLPLPLFHRSCRY